jgi:hypothetical protein
MLPRDLDRRETLGLIGVSLIALPLNGCLFALMRILVGRGLAGTIARAGRLGRTASALTFGRGVAIAARLAPARTAALPSTQILGPGRRLIAYSESSAAESKVYIDNSAIFHSRRTPFGFRHYDFNGPVGRSFTRPGDDVVRHQNEDGGVTAIDRIRRLNRLVEHFSGDGSKIGETRFEQSGAELSVTADQAAMESINAARDALGLQCPDVRAAFDEWQRYKKLCSNGDSAACRDVSSKGAKYQFLKSRCSSTN